METTVVEAECAIGYEERLRLLPYRLLARYLAAPPDGELLELTRALEGDDTPFGRALTAFAAEAADSTPEAAGEEYHALFIGLGRSEILPYASYYLTGFLQERPLARLRADLERLGVARAEGCPEPEDHAAALCEVMAGLIAGTFGDGRLATQKQFFETHVATWMGRLFADLEEARSARLYRRLGTVGRRFLDIEGAAFAMVDGHEAAVPAGD
ncbi:MAG TPA: molecular chaperone TorD [Rhodospirillales bacterium]|nr:molecular chaperone TorD [Rhodospirillales bacterium]